MSLFVSIQKRLGAFQLETSFETDSGVMGLLGASGCGKSLTLKCIAGIERPDTGRIVLNGRTLFDAEKGIDLPPQKRNVGYLFQSGALFPNMTVRQNILCGLRREKNRLAREQAAETLLSMLELHGLENHRPRQLSGGQAQRVALARILASQPDLLMLDEPFSALDPHLRDKLQLQMRGWLAQFGKDVLLVTHSRDEAYHMCGHIAVMDAGRLLLCKETKRLFADPEHIQAAVLTGCKNITSARQAGEYLVDAPEWGIRLHTAKPVGADITSVGIRAHHFAPEIPENRFSVRITGGMEEPFETIVAFRYAAQSEAAPDLWWRLSSEKLPETSPAALGVAPERVLLLRG